MKGVEVFGCLVQSAIALAGFGMVAWSFTWYLADNTLNAIYWLMLSVLVFLWAYDVGQKFEERAKEAEREK